MCWSFSKLDNRHSIHTDILGQTAVQASGREHLRELLNRASGGVVFTTIHKFMPEKGEAMPELSARQNIVVIADEAHRGQYGFGGKVNEKTGEMSYGFASNLRDALPNASFIGFTGTPIEKTNASTRAVFGDYTSIYDIQRAVADQATVPIYYECYISKLRLNAAELLELDAEFEEITEGDELTRRQNLKTKWAALEALVGDPELDRRQTRRTLHAHPCRTGEAAAPERCSGFAGSIRVTSFTAKRSQ